MQKVLDHYNTKGERGGREAVGVLGWRSVGRASDHWQKLGVSYVVVEPWWMKFAAEIE